MRARLRPLLLVLVLLQAACAASLNPSAAPELIAVSYHSNDPRGLAFDFFSYVRTDGLFPCASGGLLPPRDVARLLSILGSPEVNNALAPFAVSLATGQSPVAGPFLSLSVQGSRWVIPVSSFPRSAAIFIRAYDTYIDHACPAEGFPSLFTELIRIRNPGAFAR